MTLRALHGLVSACQREWRAAVVERRALPLRRCMAEIALGRKSRCLMIRARSLVEIVEVAAGAIHGKPDILAVAVARRASHAGVRPGQFELAHVVIELRVLPVRGGVAGVALGWNVSLRMRRIVGLLVIRQMAAGTIHRCPREFSVDMAAGACNIDVRPGEWKLRGVVIKRCSQPICHRMATRAIVRKSGGCVRRTCSAVVVVDVATEAIGRRTRELAAHVACDATHRCVRAEQREACECGVVKLSALPLVGSVAGVALERKFRRRVVGVLCFLKIAQVAACAVGAQSDKYAAGRSPMAGVARNSRMCPKERKPVQVVLDGSDRHLPAANGMAILAGAAELSAMNVGMAIRTHLADVAEYFADVALAAGYVFVQSAQRKLRLRVVIELRFRTDRFPARRGVATFASSHQRTVRIGRAWRIAHLRVCRCANQQNRS